ncbi:AraC family transcriptional regulator [Vannielia litorea]|uniref:Transcriptional regulator, AraC family n=1 Tax=Vannielia litorea TaxID=1217970 RepID=A0A1N6DV87_9RHOB|nr:AraC family transcriptional regulator [Vannielia litorea]SIN74671.1 transcriptional regulator, AraC family [Vannielia litorea]
MDYQRRIDRVMSHIQTNLDGDLSLDVLAEVAAFSRFHFHRVYVRFAGETVAETVRRTRLNRAAVALAMSEMPLERVAAVSGYPNPQSFARAYRAGFGETPTDTRRARIIPPPMLPQRQGETAMYDVETRQEPGFSAAGLFHQGAYQQIGQSFERLIGQLIGAGMMGQLGDLIALYYDDPSSVPVNELRSHAGVILPDGAKLPEGLEPIVMQPGEVAVLTYKGPYTGLPTAWSYMYGEGLPRLGRDPKDAAPYERYLNSPMDTDPSELLTEVVVPLA